MEHLGQGPIRRGGLVTLAGLQLLGCVRNQYHVTLAEGP